MAFLVQSILRPEILVLWETGLVPQPAHMRLPRIRPVILTLNFLLIRIDEIIIIVVIYAQHGMD
jgi:hypothetical protein